MNKGGIDPTILIPNALLMIVVTFGVLVNREPLRSVRPAAAAEARNIVTLTQVKARPWEDPLAVRERLGKEGRTADTVNEAESAKRDAAIKNILETASQEFILENPVQVTNRAADLIVRLLRSDEPSSAKGKERREEEIVAMRMAVEKVLTDSANASNKDSAFLAISLVEILEDGGEVEARLNSQLRFPIDLVVAVLVPGGFEPAAVERRIRIRQAVVAGMTHSQYLPEDSEHMLTVEVPVRKSGKGRAKKSGGAKAAAGILSEGTGENRKGKSNVTEKGIARFVAEDFRPEELVPRRNDFALRALPLPKDEGNQIGSELRTLLGDRKRFYDRIRVVYLDFEEMRRAWGKDNRNPLGKTTLESAWGQVVSIISKNGSAELDVIGPPSSDDLMELLLLPSPMQYKNNEIDVFSPFATLESDLLLHKIREKIANSDYLEMGRNPVPSVEPLGEPNEISPPWLKIFKKGEEIVAYEVVTGEDGESYLEEKTEIFGERLKKSEFEQAEGNLLKDFDRFTLLKCDRGDILAILHRRRSKDDVDWDTGYRTHIHPEILPDNRTATSLVTELGNRGIKFTNSDDMIVLISESDSLYGKAFPVTFHKEILRRVGVIDEKSGALAGGFYENARKGIISVRNFHYLKGLDGRTVLAKGTKVGLQDYSGDAQRLGELGSVLKSPVKSSSQPARADWRPEGTQQYDRIEALSKILRQHQGLVVGRKSGRVVAVGVVGSDIYDKLVILQAMRSAVPGAVFFTTDLDANMLTRENYRITRNLIVASSFGLQLDEFHQGWTTPFRSSYQTAVFHSVLRCNAFYYKNRYWDRDHQEILGGTPHPRENLDISSWNPNLFEIGLNGAVSLRPAPDPGNLNVVAGGEITGLPPNQISPDGINPNVYWLGCAFMVIGVFILLWISDPGDRNRWRPSGRLERCSIIALVMAVSFFSTDKFLPGISGNLPGLFAGCVFAMVAFALFELWGVCLGRIFFFVVASAGLLSLCGIMYNAHYTAGQEPVGFLDGLSAWSSQLLRFIGLVLGVFYAVLAALCSGRAREDAVDLLEKREIQEQGIEQKHWEEQAANCPNVRGTERENPLLDEVLSLARKGNSTDEKRSYWQRWADARRSLILGTIILMIVPLGLFVVLGFPPKPIRGETGRTLDFMIVFGNIFVMYLLTAFAILRNLFCWKNLIQPCERALLPLAKANDPKGESAAAKHAAIGDPDFAKFLLKVIETYSAEIARLPLYPCLIILLMVVSRNGRFDNWTVPAAIFLAVAYVIGVLGVANLFLNHRARTLKQNLLKLVRDKKATTPRKAPTVEDEETGIAAVNRGVFGSFLTNPVFRAALIPIGGGGLIAMIELLSNSIP